ncbi:hypothetical protein E4U21_000701 [Claviceps maximensis]|nr:hypothetical protein E4U21_000701 [Claviceps maximensis]
MASISRQPFAPLDGARLQSLTSWKNRQNAITQSNSIKRKADLLDTDNDSENVDPCLFAKRSRGVFGTPNKDRAMKKPSAFALTKATTTPSTPRAKVGALLNPIKASTGPRRTLQPRSPTGKVRGNATKSSPLSAPAGRSPTRGTRSGLLSNHRQTTGLYTRVDPPSVAPNGASSFSLNAALKGTISSYGSRARSNALSKASSCITSALGELDAMGSWFFDIHEDTPEQEMTNLLQHGTCVLDISSDEENEQRARREKAEGRDKENVPPSGDASQTPPRRWARTAAPDDMVVEKERVVLGEMAAADLVAAGGDANSVMIIPGHDDDDHDDNEEELAEPASETAPAAKSQFTTEGGDAESLGAIDGLIASSDPEASAAVLQPIDGAGESFDLWESGSVKDDSGLVASES